MLRGRGLLLALATALLTGCAVDRIEWESSGFPVEEVTRTLEEEHHAVRPAVRCIKREVGGAVWECRAAARQASYHCEVKVGPREAIRSLVCEREVEEEAEPAEE